MLQIMFFEIPGSANEILQIIYLFPDDIYLHIMLFNLEEIADTTGMRVFTS